VIPGFPWRASIIVSDGKVWRLARRHTLILILGCGGCSEVLDPAGPIGAQEKVILLNSLAIMLAIIVPTIAATLGFAWWFRADNPRAKRQPDFVYSGKVELVTWSIPLLTILFLGGIAWLGSHSLEPSRPLAAATPPLEVEVVALDWKWLFNYPEQGVASVNHLVVPAGRPLHFRLTSASVMNSFFIPRLGSMIYVMNGMVTQLHLRADQPGHLNGLATHFSGDGFSNMRFDVEVVAPAEFAGWTAATHGRKEQLDRTTYQHLAEQGTQVRRSVYGSVAPGLFDAIVSQHIPPAPGPTVLSSNRERTTH
jgi:cytochrome o ubiquinol oxidase subunit II